MASRFETVYEEDIEELMDKSENEEEWQGAVKERFQKMGD